MNELVNDRLETVRRYEVRTTCDRCKAVIQPPRSGDFDTTTIVNESGSSYEDFYDSQLEGVDCCVDCWELVRAALVELGFTIRAWEHDRETRATYSVDGRPHTFEAVE
jgi:hypothetical protein